MITKEKRLLVPGNGPVPCNIMLIGEAPGQQESIVGEPFVGRAGQLLTKAIEAAGMTRDEVFITNTYKYRPPNNRKPTQEEILSQDHLLKAEIQAVNPELIILLGNTALEAYWDFNGTTGVGKFRGRNISKDFGRRVFVTYHPSAGLRSNQYREPLFSDLYELLRVK